MGVGRDPLRRPYLLALPQNAPIPKCSKMAPKCPKLPQNVPKYLEMPANACFRITEAWLGWRAHLPAKLKGLVGCQLRAPNNLKFGHFQNIPVQVVGKTKT